MIAHEVGHAMLFSLFGAPANGLASGDFGPFHEANADLISLLSFLHFDSGMDRLLRHCGGNLLVLNELANRIAELTGDRQIRLASNARRMSEVTEKSTTGRDRSPAPCSIPWSTSTICAWCTRDWRTNACWELTYAMSI